MATTDRQNRLLIAEDWKKIYTSFQQADFKSYDFETLRRTMVAYIRENYPDDFNDFIESSEYIALIDLIAYIAQSLSFRVDLNARENFLETAERRNSVLRLARLINYNAKRNKSAQGLLKLNSVSTTENVIDSTGTDLVNTTIVWNDSSNPNYREQMIAILNSANVSGQRFGKPRQSKRISSILTDVYTINSTQIDLPIYKFSKSISGTLRNFEIVPSTIEGKDYIYEAAPIEGTGFTYLYRTDGAGDSSNNTGFFLQFKQGNIGSQDFTIDQPTTNYVQQINISNINNDDVWLYKLDDISQIETQWTQVPALSGNNAIYNSLQRGIRTIYNVVTKNTDAIDLVFGDGNFADIPKGPFRLYYRTSANEKYSIQPSDIQNVVVNIPYTDKNGGAQTLTLNAGLVQSVYNADTSESTDSIKEKAPQVYYSQNRMITAEDYNVVPLSVSQNILKSRAVNRIASGISRQKEIIDPTGAYSNTNVFADDGILYKEETNPTFSFTFSNNNEILNALNNQIEAKLKEPYIRQFYYDKFPFKDTSTTGASWVSTTTSTNSNTGYFTAGGPLVVGNFATSNFKYAKPGALIKFTSPDSREFLNGVLVTAGTTDAEDRAWAKIGSVEGDGANGGAGNLESGIGPITLTDIIPTNSVVSKIIPPFTVNLGTSLKLDLQDRINGFEEFGLRYDQDTQTWKVITNANLSSSSIFSLTNTGDSSGAGLDASWFFKFTNDGSTYTVTYRELDYIFESESQNRFYYEKQDKIYDYKAGRAIKDNVKILKNNTLPDSNNSIGYSLQWEIVDVVQESDGFNDNRKVKIGFSDTDDDGVVDNPELFEIAVAPETNKSTKFAFFEKYVSYDNIERYRPVSASNFLVFENESSVNLAGQYTNGQKFYFYSANENVFKTYSLSSNSLTTTTGYLARPGRTAINFQYKHFAGQTTRIDPSLSNVIDIFMLERNYDELFRSYLKDQTTEPTASTSDQLRISYSSSLDSIKGLSDQIVYHPVKYKVLFGAKATSQFQATFKVVKNTTANATNSVIKTRVIQAINEFFALDNFDFGDTFYFTELAAYIHKELAPDLSTVVIVPKEIEQGFGSLFQISAAADEIFISGATVDDVEIIDSLGANQLAASGTVVTSTTETTTNRRSTSAVSSVTSTTSGTITSGGSTGY
jgi:hypothetical protein